MVTGLDRRELRDRLADAFDGSSAERRAVARSAGDIADAGLYERDAGHELTVETVLDHLHDAPAHEVGDEGVAARWNWWMRSLDLAFGDYERFRVREVDRE